MSNTFDSIFSGALQFHVKLEKAVLGVMSVHTGRGRVNDIFKEAEVTAERT